jgi:hypothetical protein
MKAQAVEADDALHHGLVEERISSNLVAYIQQN